MADWYIDGVVGLDTNDGLTKQTAKKTLTNVFSLASPGDRIGVRDIMTGQYGVNTVFNSPGTAINPVHIYSISWVEEGFVPSISHLNGYSSFGQFWPTGSYSLTIGSGFAYWYGISFCCGSAGTGNSMVIGSAAAHGHVFEDCIFGLGSTSNLRSINIGTAAVSTNTTSFLKFIRPRFGFANSAQFMTLRNGHIRIEDAILSTIQNPASGFIRAAGNSVTNTEIVGGDFSSVGNTLFNLNFSATGRIHVQGAKLPEITAITNPVQVGSVELFLDGCDSGTQTVRRQIHRSSGIITTDTGVYRTGGAKHGETPISHRFASVAIGTPIFPLESMEPIVGVFNSTGLKTVTLHVASMGSDFDTGNLWMGLTYLGDADSSKVITASTRTMPHVSATAYSTSSASWVGITPVTKLALTLQVDVKHTGPFSINFSLGKPDATIYVCPKPEIS